MPFGAGRSSCLQAVHQKPDLTVGLSEVNGELLRRAYAVYPIPAVQSEYSVWSRDLEASAGDALRELGVALVAYSPLGRGFLTGTVDVTAPQPPRPSPGAPRAAGCARPGGAPAEVAD